MKRWIVALLVGLVVVVGAGAAAWFWWPQPPLFSPLSRFGYIEFSDSQAVAAQDIVILGFVPYWTLQTTEVSPVMTDAAYFAVSLGPDGKLQEVIGGEREMGWARLQNDSFLDWLETRHAAGQKVHITVTAPDNESIALLVADAARREQARVSLQQLLLSYPFDAVQLDFEYVGNASPALREQYALFVRELDAALAEVNPNIALSVAVFGSAPSRELFWDLKALEPSVDFFVFMAYDYHVRSSAVVGPVAPIFGRSAGRWEHDIVTNLRDFLQIVPANKILLGIPFYGYQWAATDDGPGATTYPRSGATATYDRVMKLLEDPKQKAQEQWDEDALSPYLSFVEDGQTQVIYYENERSLGYKAELVRQLGLRGVAIWAVGYEGNRTELWDVLDRKL